MLEESEEQMEKNVYCIHIIQNRNQYLHLCIHLKGQIHFTVQKWAQSHNLERNFIFLTCLMWHHLELINQF